MKTQLTRFAALIMTVGALAACEDDGPTGIEGEASGEVTAEVYDGSSSSASMAAMAASQSSFNGSMSANAEVQIYSDVDGWVALGSPSSANVDLQSNERVTVASRASVPASSYTRVRLVLTNASATVLAGATIGSSVLDADVTMTVGGSDGQVTIEKEMAPFTVTAEAETTLQFDLNSELWVDGESTQSQTATDAEVSSAVAVLITN